MGELAVILGDQLFKGLPGIPKECPIFMREDIGLATRYSHHQQKIVLFFSTMRHFSASLGRRVIYQTYGSDSLSFLESLTKTCHEEGITKVWFYPANDPKSFNLSQFEVEHTVLPESPMFLTPNDEWQRYTNSSSRR